MLDLSRSATDGSFKFSVLLFRMHVPLKLKILVTQPDITTQKKFDGFGSTTISYIVSQKKKKPECPFNNSESNITHNTTNITFLPVRH